MSGTSSLSASSSSGPIPGAVANSLTATPLSDESLVEDAAMHQIVPHGDVQHSFEPDTAPPLHSKFATDFEDIVFDDAVSNTEMEQTKSGSERPPMMPVEGRASVKRGSDSAPSTPRSCKQRQESPSALSDELYFGFVCED